MDKSRKRRLGSALAVVTATVALAATAALAAIDSTSGAVQEVSPPSSVAENALESNTRIVAFDEKQCVTLASNLNVDVVPGGGGGVIAAGTRVSSQFLHFEPHTGTLTTLGGSITTDTAVLGLIVTPGSLDASDPVLGATGTTYPTGNTGRGLEHGDSAVISGTNTVTVSLTERFHLDQVRVVSECPPPAEAFCEETVNPHGKTVPPAGSTTQPGPRGGINDDGFYRVGSSTGGVVQLTDTDGNSFGSFPSGTRVKYTEANGATPSVKKIGSTNGKAGAVDYHITGTGDLVVTADGDSTTCPVPPPPK